MESSTKHSTEEYKDRKFASTLISSAYAIRLLRGLSSGWLGPLIPTIALIQGLSLVKTAFMFSVYFCGLLIMLLVGPMVLSRLGGKNCMVAAALCYATGFVTIALASGAYMLWLGALFVGLGAGLSIPCGTLCVIRLSGSNPGSALSKYATLYGIGALIGPLIAFGAMATSISYSTVYLAGALCALAIGYVLYSLKDRLVIKDESGKSERDKLIREPHIWGFALLLFFYVGIESSAAAWLFVYLKESCLLEESFASFGMTALWTGLTLGRLTAIKLCKHYSSLTIIVGALTLAATCLSLLLASPELPVLALSLVFVLGLGFGPVFPNIIAAGTSKYPSSIGTVTSIMMLIGVPGGILFPWLTGMMGQGNQMHATIAMLFLMTITIATTILATGKVGSEGVLKLIRQGR